MRYIMRRKKQRRWPKVLFYIFLFPTLIFGFWALVPVGVSPIVGADGQDIPGSISLLESVELNGLEQWLLIRGHSETAPVLLIVHGGPGNTTIPLAKKYQAELERHFVVVNWDQRGAGKSWTANLSAETMNVQQFVGDLTELSRLLAQRFEQEKIYLVGHSWGSYIGLLAVQQEPELFHAYVGVGQMVHTWAGEALAYEYSLAAAAAADDQKALADLEDLGPPPWDDMVGSFTRQRKWLSKYGGTEYQGNIMQDYVKAAMFGREYTLVDCIRAYRGLMFSIDNLLPALAEVDLPKQIPAVEVPVYFGVGRHDYNTPSELVHEYMQVLDAPAKTLVWFEESAHSPLFEEPEQFADLLITQVLAETTP